MCELMKFAIGVLKAANVTIDYDIIAWSATTKKGVPTDTPHSTF